MLIHRFAHRQWQITVEGMMFVIVICLGALMLLIKEGFSRKRNYVLIEGWVLNVGHVALIYPGQSFFLSL